METGRKKQENRDVEFRSFFLFPFSFFRRGQSLIELLVAIAIGALFVISVSAVIAPSLKENTQAGNVQVGTALGKELLDNVRVWSEHDWHGIMALATGSINTYYLNSSSSPFQIVTGTSSTFPNGYSYRRTITLGRASNSDQPNFPVLISTAGSPYSDMAASSSGGAVQSTMGNDIVFSANPSGTPQLYAEQESYSSSTGAIVYWVQVPSLSASVNTQIYMFYGNPDPLLVSPGYVSAQVWDSNYVGVYHLNNMSGPTVPNSTGNANASSGVLSASPPTAAAGEVAGAANFVAASHQYIAIPLNLSGGGNKLTAEMWLYESPYTTNDARADAFAIGTDGGFWIDPNHVGGKISIYSHGTNAGGPGSNDMRYLQLSAGAWHQYVFTEDGTLDPAVPINLYIDGVLKPTAAGSQSPPYYYASSLPNDTLYMMALNPGTSAWATGIQDELRISTGIRSADWINTEYRNESNPCCGVGAFSQIGGATTPSGGSILSETVTLGNVAYARSFSVGDVYRSSTGTIVSAGAAGGTLDPSSKQVVVNYAWPGSTTGGSMSTILTRNQNRVFNQTDWSGGPGQVGPATSTNNQFAAATNINYASTTGSFSLSIAGAGSAGYAFMKTITVHAAQVPNTDQPNFPVLISGTYSYLAATSSSGNVQNANGYDVGFFANADCATGKMNWETEKYTAASGGVIYWVKVSTLSHSADTVFYLCYGNSNITTDQSSPTAVWDSNYLGVWHLDENPAAAAPQFKDSTSNGNALTAQGGMTAGQSVAGQVGNGVQFNTVSGQYLTFTANPTGANNGDTGDDFSVEAIFKTNTTSGLGGLVVNGSTIPSLYVWNDGHINYYYPSGINLENTSAISVGTFYWAATTLHYNGSNYTKAIFLNGNQEATAAIGSSAGMYNQIGNDSFNQGLNGVLDEVRISKFARSSDWLKTEYNNESSPGTFYTIL